MQENAVFRIKIENTDEILPEFQKANETLLKEL